MNSVEKSKQPSQHMKTSQTIFIFLLPLVLLNDFNSICTKGFSLPLFKPQKMNRMTRGQAELHIQL